MLGPGFRCLGRVLVALRSITHASYNFHPATPYTFFRPALPAPVRSHHVALAGHSPAHTRDGWRRQPRGENEITLRRVGFGQDYMGVVIIFVDCTVGTDVHGHGHGLACAAASMQLSAKQLATRRQHFRALCM